MHTNASNYTCIFSGYVMNPLKMASIHLLNFKHLFIHVQIYMSLYVRIYIHIKMCMDVYIKAYV